MKFGTVLYTKICGARYILVFSMINAVSYGAQIELYSSSPKWLIVEILGTWRKIYHYDPLIADETLFFIGLYFELAMLMAKVMYSSKE
jgi:hypothetical protein